MTNESQKRPYRCVVFTPTNEQWERVQLLPRKIKLPNELRIRFDSILDELELKSKE